MDRKKVAQPPINNCANTGTAERVIWANRPTKGEAMPTPTKCPECDGKILKAWKLGFALEVCKRCNKTGFINPDKKPEEKKDYVNEYYNHFRDNDL